MSKSPRIWLINWLKKSSGQSEAVRVPFYVAGDGVAYAKASEVLQSTAVKRQLEDVRGIRELAKGKRRRESSPA